MPTPSPAAVTAPRLLDRLAIFFSGLCTVHCVLVTLAITAIPIWGLGFLTSPAFHEAFLLMVIPVSLLGLWAGHRLHRQRRPLLLGIAALSMMVLAVVLRDTGVVGVAGESAINIPGALLLATAHWMNLRRGQSACPRH